MWRRGHDRLPVRLGGVGIGIGIGLGLAACASVAPAGGAGPRAVTSPGAGYVVYVANESADVVSRVVFTPGVGARVEREIPVGIMPADIDGPHGLAVSPDRRSWYVSLAHGRPFGEVWKYEAAADAPVGRVQLGLFPATMGLTPDGQFLLVVNFNLHGDPVPSSVSVVYTPTMTEVARPTTCVMPHGSRVSASGARHYSACMHSEQLVELDTRSFEVSGRFSVAPGREGPLPLDETGAHGGHSAPAGGAVCSPTWAAPGRGARADRTVYVACNRSAEVLEIDVVEWRVRRRFPTDRGPYNLELTPDGRLLLVTLKASQGVAIFDLERGEQVARLATTQPVTHGVVVTPDGRYAFISNEAVGSTRGTVDVLDLDRLERVASVQVGHQPGGIDFAGMTTR